MFLKHCLSSYVVASWRHRDSTEIPSYLGSSRASSTEVALWRARRRQETQRADESLSVDCKTERPAHEHVGQWRDVMVDAQLDNLAFQIGKIGFGIGGIELRNRRRKIGLACLHHGRAQSPIGAE